MGSLKVVRLLVEYFGRVLFLTRPISEIFLYWVHRIFMGKTKCLPPIKNRTLLHSATKLAEKIRNREIKCQDVMQVYIERACEVNPFINAVTDNRYIDALEDAKKVDNFLQNTDKSPEEIEKATPLLGVPFSCKESIGVKGLTQTCGLVNSKGRVKDKDSDAASLYRAAGAIPVTVTNVPEFMMWWDATNLLYGMTKNPYDNLRTVGGSSGGEGALITSGGAVIGIGSDVGGSIRFPSSFNGIYGHKPSRGVVSNDGFYPSIEEETRKINHIWQTGPLCRYAEDLPLLMKILSKNNSRLKAQKIDFHKVKIYFMETLPGKYLEATSEIKKSVRDAVTYMEDKFGLTAIPLKIEEMEHGFHIWECKILETNVSSFKLNLADENGHINIWWELLKSIFRRSKHTLSSIFFGLIEKRDKDQSYYEGLKMFDKIEKKFLEIFKEDAIVVLPTQPEPPPLYHLTIPKFLNITYTDMFNVLGFPVTIVPAGMVKGLPIALQLVGGRLKDHLTIAAAQELDKCFGGWKSPCRIEL